MRILQVVSSSRTSGAERHVAVLSDKLRRSGHTVAVVCPEGDWLPDQLRAEGVPAIELPMRGSGSWKTAVRVARVARRYDADVIHAHLTRATYLSFVAGRLARRPVFSTVHVRTRDFAYRFLFSRQRSRIIAVSDYLRDMLLRQGVPEAAVRTVHNGTDFGFAECPADAEGDALPVRAEFSLPPDAELVGLFGRVDEFKGQPLLIDAIPSIVSACPRAYFLCVGPVTPAMQRALWETAAAHGVAERVRFTGVRDDVERLVRETDVVTLPSRYEACSMSIIEAMALGKPVVATRAGGNPELVVHGETGLLIDRTASALSEGLVALLRSERRRREMGRAARVRAEQRFSATGMAQTIASLYEEAAAR